MHPTSADIASNLYGKLGNELAAQIERECVTYCGGIEHYRLCRDVNDRFQDDLRALGAKYRVGIKRALRRRMLDVALFGFTRAA